MTICSIVIPVYKSEVTEEESISLQLLNKFCGEKTIIIVTHKELVLDRYIAHFKDKSNIEVKLFPKPYFEDRSSYNRMLLSKGFFEHFLAYDYILIYQTDCLIFSNDLDQWINRGYDYIGAPWIDDSGEGFVGVGNGGFSLRKVSSHLRVLKSFKYIYSMSELREMDFYKQSSFLKKIRILVASKTLKNNFFWKFNNFHGNEDEFWSTVVSRNFKWFKVPKEEVALQFAFERFPEKLFQLNKEFLPLGCHAWSKYDKEFWLEKIRVFIDVDKTN